MNKAFEKILEMLDKRCDVIVASKEEYLPFSNVISKPLITEKDYDTSITIKEAKKIVQEVAEEYNGGWIPCSERLPEEDENVLTCSEYGFITVSSCNDTGEFSSYADEYCIKYPKPKVIAWQPLPEPYKPEGE